MTLSRITIPAGTIVYLADLPLLLQCEVPVEGTPEEIADVHLRLYPSGGASARLPVAGVVPSNEKEGSA